MLVEVSDDNGHLCVVPASHRTGKELRVGDTAPRSILIRSGDVLLMRASRHSTAETPLHRRILHLEFAASPELPDGYAWHEFRPAPGRT